MKSATLLAICITASFASFSLNAMEATAGPTDHAKNHVDILFSCHPIFDIALTESDEIFNGNLVEFRGYLQYRVEFHSVNENGSFLKVLERQFAARKTAFLKLLKEEPSYSESERSTFANRLGLIDKALSDFTESYQILQRGDWDHPLPISAGLEKKSNIPNQESLSKGRSVSNLVVLAAGGLMIGIIFWCKWGH